MHGLGFAGLQAVDSVDLSIARGEIVGLIGPNGAGKTTFVNLLTGELPVTSGSILYEGRDITRLSRTGVAISGWRAPSRFPGPSTA